MTTVVAKGILTPTFTLTCTPSDHQIFSSAYLTVSSNMIINRTTSIVLNMDALQLSYSRNSQYTVVINPGFVTDDSGLNNPTTSSSFTSSSGPILLTEYLGYSPTDSTNNTKFSFFYDRPLRPGAVGNKVYLYNSNGTLIHNWTSSQVTFSNTNPYAFNVPLAGYLIANTHYYWTIDADFVYDYDGIGNTALTSNIVTFLTASEPDFHDLTAHIYSTTTATISVNQILAADRLLFISGANASYVEDTLSPVGNYPYITDFNYNGNSSYTCTITTSDSTAFTSLVPVGVTGNYNYNSSTNTLTLTDTKTKVNNMLSNLVITPSVDYEGTFTLSYALTTPTNGNITKSQTVVRGTPYDTQVTNLPTTFTYTANQGNQLFPTTYISDFDTHSGITYTVTLTVDTNIGAFNYTTGDSTTVSSTFVMTGSKSEVNALLPTVKFYPKPGSSANGSFTYNQIKSDYSGTQVNQTITLIGTNNPLTSITTTFTSSGYLTVSWEQSYYYNKVDVLLVGGGGAGNRGGGAGGQVLYATNQTIPKGNYSVTVGTGGQIANGVEYTLDLGPNNQSYYGVSWNSSGGGGGGSIISGLNLNLGSGVITSAIAGGGSGGKNQYTLTRGTYNGSIYSPSIESYNISGGDTVSVTSSGTTNLYGSNITGGFNYYDNTYHPFIVDERAQAGGGGAGAGGNGNSPTFNSTVNGTNFYNGGLGGQGVYIALTGQTYGAGGNGGGLTTNGLITNSFGAAAFPTPNSPAKTNPGDGGNGGQIYWEFQEGSQTQYWPYTEDQGSNVKIINGRPYTITGNYYFQKFNPAQALPGNDGLVQFVFHQ